MLTPLIQLSAIRPLFLIAALGCSAPDLPTAPAGKTAQMALADVCPVFPDTLISDPIPDKPFNIRVRMSPEFDARWDRSKNHVIGRALDKWESVILERPTNDYPMSGLPLDRDFRWAEFSIPDEDYFGEFELEILMTYLWHIPLAASSALKWEQGNGQFIPFSFLYVGNTFFDGIQDGRINDDILYLILLHEFGHALGFGYKDNDFNNEVRERFGHSCRWVGLQSLTAWNLLLEREEPLHFVPLEPDCGHWDYRNPNWRTLKDVMFPNVGEITPTISPMTVGYFDDIGFAVDYEKADDPVKVGVRLAGKRTTDLINWHGEHPHLGVVERLGLAQVEAAISR